jgi:hypothetical protein
MKQVMRSALIVAAAQYFAVILGVYWCRARIVFQRHRLSPWAWPGDFTLLDMLYGLRASVPLPTLQGIEWIHAWHLEACLATLALAIAGVRLLVSAQLRRTHRKRMWVCLSLFCYLAWLMYTEPFLNGSDDTSFVIGVLLLTPVLLAMSLLVRCREWLGLAGAVVFLATSVAMMIENGCPRGGLTGFFYAAVW